MIAAQDDFVYREADFLRDIVHVGDELLSRHAGVPAELVHLIGGGFDAEGRRRSPLACIIEASRT